MHKKFIVANWKMNLSLSEAKKLVSNILKELKKKNPPKTNIILCVPYVYINILSQMTSGIRNVFIGAQNSNENNTGAFTGEISCSMLKSCGVDYLIVGHSERRSLYNESNKVAEKKILQSITNNILPIFCCGETLEARKNKTYFDSVNTQINESLFNLDKDQFSKITIAYEPVWSIGTGMTAELKEIEEMHKFIRNKIRNKYGKSISATTPILYGGSVTSLNASNIFGLLNVNGSLVGGASLNADDFMNIVKVLT